MADVPSNGQGSRSGKGGDRPRRASLLGCCAAPPEKRPRQLQHTTMKRVEALRLGALLKVYKGAPLGYRKPAERFFWYDQHANLMRWGKKADAQQKVFKAARVLEVQAGWSLPGGDPKLARLPESELPESERTRTVYIKVAEFGPRALVFGGSAAAEMWYEVMQEAVEEAASNLAGASIAGGKEDDDGGTTDSKNAEDGLTRAITSELLVEGVEARVVGTLFEDFGDGRRPLAAAATTPGLYEGDGQPAGEEPEGGHGRGQHDWQRQHRLRLTSSRPHEADEALVVLDAAADSLPAPRMTGGQRAVANRPEFWRRSSQRTPWTAQHGRFCGVTGTVQSWDGGTEVLMSFAEVPVVEVEAEARQHNAIHSTRFSSVFGRLGFVTMNELQRTVMRQIPWASGGCSVYNLHVPLTEKMLGEKVTAVMVAAIPHLKKHLHAGDARETIGPRSLIMSSSDAAGSKMRHTLEKFDFKNTEVEVDANQGSQSEPQSESLQKQLSSSPRVATSSTIGTAEIAGRIIRKRSKNTEKSSAPLTGGGGGGGSDGVPGPGPGPGPEHGRGHGHGHGGSSPKTAFGRRRKWYSVYEECCDRGGVAVTEDLVVASPAGLLALLLDPNNPLDASAVESLILPDAGIIAADPALAKLAVRCAALIRTASGGKGRSKLSTLFFSKSAGGGTVGAFAAFAAEVAGPRASVQRVAPEPNVNLWYPVGCVGLLPKVGEADRGSANEEDQQNSLLLVDCPSSSEPTTHRMEVLQAGGMKRHTASNSCSHNGSHNAGPDGHTTVEEYGPGRAINRRAMVLSNQDVVRSYFKTNDAPFDALLSAETGALWFAFGHFSAAFALGALAWHALAAVYLVVALVWTAWDERRRQLRLALLADARLGMQWYGRQERTAEETPRWLNVVLIKAWDEGGVSRMLNSVIREQIELQFKQVRDGEEIIDELDLIDFTLGSTPPTVKSISFENGDVFGEVRLNCEIELDTPDCEAAIRVKHEASKLIPMKVVPITLGNVYVHADFQLLIRFGAVHSAGPTLAGLKLNKPLDLDYSLRTKFNLNLGELAGFASQCRHWPSAVSMRASPIPDWNTVEVSGVCAADESAGGIWVGFAIQKEINAMINDSMWWMQHPCMLLLPGLVRGAGSDMEANNPSRVVGQLQITVKEARDLPAADFRTSDPYVKVQVAKSWPLRQFRTEKRSCELNPIYEAEHWTQLHWNEAKTGKLIFECADHNVATPDTQLGSAELPIAAAVASAGQGHPAVLRLQDCPNAHKRKPNEVPTLYTTVQFHPAQIQTRLPMMLLGGRGASSGSVATGVLSLEVLAVRGLPVGGWGVKYSGLHCEMKHCVHDGLDTPSDRHFVSHEIKQAAPEGVPRGTLLTFRDTPVRGKRAAHEFSITDMQENIKLSLLTDSDRCVACGHRESHCGCMLWHTVPTLLRDLGLWTADASAQNGQRGQVSQGYTAKQWLLIRAPTDDGRHSSNSDGDDDLVMANPLQPEAGPAAAGSMEVQIMATFYGCKLHPPARPVASPRTFFAASGPPDVGGTLSVTLVSCDNLVHAGGGGTGDRQGPPSPTALQRTAAEGRYVGEDIDPYVVLTLQVHNKPVRVQSTAKKHTANPRYWETFNFHLGRSDRAGSPAVAPPAVASSTTQVGYGDCMLHLSVHDKDLGKDPFRGAAAVNIAQLMAGNWVDTRIDQSFALRDPAALIGDKLLAGRGVFKDEPELPATPRNSTNGTAAPARGSGLGTVRCRIRFAARASPTARR